MSPLSRCGLTVGALFAFSSFMMAALACLPAAQSPPWRGVIATSHGLASVASTDGSV